MGAVGVDACRGGWIAIHLVDGRVVEGVFLPTIGALDEAIPDAEGVGIDIPLGLPADGVRASDVLAREELGPRRSSLFPAPIRAALEASSYAEANALSKRRTDRGVSRQSYALRPKILEAEAWRAEAELPVWEVHPELSFAELLGHPAGASKKTWAGHRERVVALREVGIELLELGDLGEAGQRAAADDVLDAAVAAWSAARLLRGEGRSLPDPPETDPATGLPMAIWV